VENNINKSPKKLSSNKIGVG